MRKNAEKVVEAFKAGKRYYCLTMYTDGQEVYSYFMLIAKRTSKGIELIEYNKAPSATTRTHVRALEITFPSAIRVIGF